MQIGISYFIEFCAFFVDDGFKQFLNTSTIEGPGVSLGLSSSCSRPASVLISSLSSVHFFPVTCGCIVFNINAVLSVIIFRQQVVTWFYDTKRKLRNY